MNRMEQVIILECLREIRPQLGIQTKVLAAELGGDDERLVEAAKNSINRQPVHRKTEADVAERALETLRANRKMVLEHFSGQNTALANYLATLIGQDEQDGADDAAVPSASAVGGLVREAIFQSWRDTTKKGEAVLRSGVYQIYRRYKPTIEPSDANRGGGADPTDHPVICELIYVDSGAMQTRLITSERYVYAGTMTINHEQVCIGLLQRIMPNGGVNRRVIAMELLGRARPLYSGICLKVGDTMRRPLACECLFVPVAREQNEDLYRELEGLLLNENVSKKAIRLPSDSVSASYITSNPPLGEFEEGSREWNGVTFLSDFPYLLTLARPDRDGRIFFKEPLRTIGDADIIRLLHHGKLGVFRRGTEMGPPE